VGLILNEVIRLSNCPNPSSHTMALGSNQPLTEMSTRNLPGGKGRPVCKADGLTVISEPTVQKMWEPQTLITLQASVACYKDSFTFFSFLHACHKIVPLANPLNMKIKLFYVHTSTEHSLCSPSEQDIFLKLSAIQLLVLLL
jgi:hypothetical protein